jgi:hypothetical protein
LQVQRGIGSFGSLKNDACQPRENERRVLHGWEEKAPPALAAWVRSGRSPAHVGSFALGVCSPWLQHTIGVSVFEWGKVKTFSGILKSQPYPHLLVPRPGAKGRPSGILQLLSRETIQVRLDAEPQSLDGKCVRVKEHSSSVATKP